MRFAFVGDVWLRGEGVSEEKTDSLDPFEAVKPLFYEHDVVSGNLECFFTDDMSNWRGHWKHQKVLKAPHWIARSLVDAGFSAVSLANNHMLDGGGDGLKQTLERLYEEGVPWFGAGNNEREARKPCILDIGGTTVAFLSAGDSSEDYATNQRAGIAPLEPFAELLSATRSAADQASVVVVQLHCDLEFSPAPAPYRVQLSRDLIDAGATMVIQHHPHVVQGVERYKGGLIAYSLGNFLFKLKGNSYQKKYPETRFGCVLSIELSDDASVQEWRVIPVEIQDDDRPVLLTGACKARFEAEFEQRCRILENRASLRKAWRKRCWEEGRYHATVNYYNCRRGQFVKVCRYIGDLLRRPRNRYWFKGLFSFGYR